MYASELELAEQVHRRSSALMRKCTIVLEHRLGSRSLDLGLIDKHWPIIMRSRFSVRRKRLFKHIYHAQNINDKSGLIIATIEKSTNK